ncbi:thioredoxin family protein [Sandaracinobacter sp. RS1-74]|uniref:thioredoxin family protein n=1 Tax=Sandaracinobacteroides sayramensis TaxID=2913411 RepID=UPI001EDBC1E1|nr:thioredoxin family protein [Sandaracinobacteroides sayramensis]MCG2842097.1 thioredoxin family protein [Sandaracinobacteroides sayramensis]
MTISAKLRLGTLAAPLALLSALALLPACSPPAAEKAAEKAGVAEIAWRDGDVADAFQEAAEQGKPVLLYWGAVWCPPCNRLKAGLFKDPDFVARTRDFIPVYLDGDSAGAQAWGERFKIKGYPTLIILRPDRTEVTRLSGSGDPGQVTATLAAVQKGSANVAELLKRAQSDPKALSADDWTVIAGFGGWQDEEAEGGAAATLAKLAAVAPTEPLKRQFALQALAQRPKDAPALTPAAQAEARKTLEAVLASPEELRGNRSTLTYGAVRLVQAAAPAGPEREALAKALVTGLDGFHADESLGTGDRLSSLGAEIALYRASHPNGASKDIALPPELVEKVHQRVAWADGAAKNPYERQSLISTAARLLGDAGDKPGAERLLKAELEKSQAPYYYMPSLAKLAEERGDTGAAVDWLKRGYETSEGPASRVQWGVTYVEGLLRLTPDDKAGIETAAAQVLGELAGQPDSYHQRTRQRLEGLGKSLNAWSASHDGAQTLEKLRLRTAEVCTGQAGDALAACRSWLGSA